MVGVSVTGNHEELSSELNPLVRYLLKEKENYARSQKHDYSHVFRKRTTFELLRLSSIAMAIEFAYAAETAFVSPILLQIGISHKLMTMTWGLSPLLGFFFSPLLGSISDRCKLSWGRRRPIITMLSLGIVLGLILVPYGEQFGIWLGDSGTASGNISQTSDHKNAAILTIIGMVILDFSADTLQTPARTYLLDMCVPEDQSRGLRAFTLLAGFGGTIGYAVGGIDWEKANIGSFLGGNIPTVFAIVTVIFVICFVVTITTFREIPLTLIESDAMLRPLTHDGIKKEKVKNNNAIFYTKQTTALELKMADEDKKSAIPTIEQIVEKYTPKDSYQNGYPTFKPDNSLHNISSNYNYSKAIENGRAKNEDQDPEQPVSLKAYLKSIFVMPSSIFILGVTNLLCWMGHVTYCLYFTDFVGEAVFHGDPMAMQGSEAAINYEAGVRFGCWGMSIYAFSCAMYSLCVNYFMKLVGTRVVYIAGILYYAIGMLVLGLWPTKWGVLVFSTSAGILYGTLFTIPYMLIADYHSRNCFKVKNGEVVPLKHKRGLGTDVAIISSMVFIAQLIVSLSVGPLVTWMQTTCAILYASSLLSFMAAFSAFFVLYV